MSGGRSRWRRLALVVLLVLSPIALLVATQLRRDVPVGELKPLYANGSSRFLELDGMSVHYRDEGRGANLLLLHGTGASLHTWDAWVTALADRFRVVRVDLPGFGLTGPDPRNDYRVDRYVTLVDDFTRRLGMETFAVAGNSLGGQIAWRYAVAHSERVTGLILVDPAGYPIAKPVLLFRLARIPGISWLMAQLDPGPITRKTLEDAYADRTLITPALVERYVQLSLREGNRRAFVARVRAEEPDRSELIGRVRARTLIMWGREDRLIPVEHASRFSRAIAGSKLVVYDHVGHVPMEEIGPRSVADARVFLSQESFLGSSSSNEL